MIQFLLSHVLVIAMALPPVTRGDCCCARDRLELATAQAALEQSTGESAPAPVRSCCAGRQRPSAPASSAATRAASVSAPAGELAAPGQAKPSSEGWSRTCHCPGKSLVFAIVASRPTSDTQAGSDLLAGTAALPVDATHAPRLVLLNREAPDNAGPGGSPRALLWRLGRQQV